MTDAPCLGLSSISSSRDRFSSNPNTGIVEYTLSVVVNDLHAFNCHITLWGQGCYHPNLTDGETHTGSSSDLPMASQQASDRSSFWSLLLKCSPGSEPLPHLPPASVSETQLPHLWVLRTSGETWDRVPGVKYTCLIEKGIVWCGCDYNGSELYCHYSQ